MLPGPPGSTLIPRLQRPTALMPTATPVGRGLGTVALSQPSSPVVLHDLCTCVQGQPWNVCRLGFGGWGSKKALPLVLALPGGTHPLWKLGAHGALETLLGWSARPRGGRQETKMASGGLVCHRCRDLPLAGAGRWTWLSCHTHKEGCTLPTSGGAARALVC
uniref:Uncharacterized protein n=1 Tax=Sus scrofa TaxID=9823 RepID=A0A4X1UGR2_PIG